MKAHKRLRQYANVFQHPHCELPGGRDPRATVFGASLRHRPRRVGSAQVEKEAKASNDGVERFIVNDGALTLPRFTKLNYCGLSTTGGDR